MYFEFDRVLTLGALASNTAILVNTQVDSSRDDGWWMIFFRWGGWFVAKTVSEGPVIFGACANMTIAQIKSYLEQDPQNRTIASVKDGGQWIKILGNIGFTGLSGNLMGNQSPADNVRNVMQLSNNILMNWAIPQGQSFSMWAYNADSSALTTGTVISFDIEYFGDWLRD